MMKMNRFSNMKKELKCLAIFPFMTLGVICGILWEAFYIGITYGVDWMDKLAESCMSKDED